MTTLPDSPPRDQPLDRLPARLLETRGLRGVVIAQADSGLVVVASGPWEDGEVDRRLVFGVEALRRGRDLQAALPGDQRLEEIVLFGRRHFHVLNPLANGLLLYLLVDRRAVAFAALRPFARSLLEKAETCLEQEVGPRWA